MAEHKRRRRQERQEEAAERQTAYDDLTLEEKLNRAEMRGGSDSRETVRLRKRLKKGKR